MFHVIGDNVDEGVKQQYMRSDIRKPDSIHYFHSLAVGDRVDFSSLSEQTIPTKQTDPKQVALSLLPSTEDDSAMRDNICVFISRVLCKSLPFFSLSFDGVVEWHIKHDFYEEMSTKSEVVSVHGTIRSLSLLYLMHTDRYPWEFFQKTRTRAKIWLQSWHITISMLLWWRRYRSVTCPALIRRYK